MKIERDMASASAVSPTTECHCISLAEYLSVSNEDTKGLLSKTRRDYPRTFVSTSQTAYVLL